MIPFNIMKQQILNAVRQEFKTINIQ